jgi:hypothetical protein
MHHTKFLVLFLLAITCKGILAQVPVREEPHHKSVFENDYVRILDVHIRPGDTTQYHIHAAPSVMVFFTKSMIGIQLMGQQATAPAEVLPGQTGFAAYDKKPVIHRVYNAGENLFHVMDIELVKNEASVDSCTALQKNKAETTINEKLVRVYKFDLAHQQTFNLPAGSCAHLLICTAGETNTAGKKIIKGKYIFFNPATQVSINNTKTGIATCILLELK